MEEKYMRRALKLAAKGRGRTSPNPMVGCVIVKDGRIIGEGYHKKYGGPHAERNALAACSEDTSGADMYVTLEPCCHFGKTPPCADAVIESGIKRVFIGSLDPNPKVGGGGAERLRQNGVEVIVGVFEKECLDLNKIFMRYITSGEPYVMLKYAMTADGKIAAASGKSKWITGEKAREDTHRDRNAYSAILVGVNTVIADDPELTCRAEGGTNPMRIVCDSALMTPLSSKLVSTAKEIPTVIATCSRSEKRAEPYIKAGCRVICAAGRDGRVNLKLLMKKLGELKIDSVIIEGGGEIAWSALRAGIVDYVKCYIAPKIFGGAGAKTPVGGVGVSEPSQAFRISEPKISRLGDDFLIEGEIKCSQG